MDTKALTANTNWSMTPAMVRSSAVAQTKASSLMPGDEVFLRSDAATVRHHLANAPVPAGGHSEPVPAASDPVFASSSPPTAAAPVSLIMDAPNLTPVIQNSSAPVAASAPVWAASAPQPAAAKPANDVEKSFDDPDQVDASVWVPSAKAALVETKTTVYNMQRLAEAVVMNKPVLLTGGTGAGKTAIVKYLAHLTNNPLRRVNLHDQTDEVELFGGYKPGPNGGFLWRDGIITSAIRNGHWLLLDEINLADAAVLERMNALLDGDNYIVLNEKDDREKVKVHPETRIFATMNPTDYAGRKDLSDAMMDRFQRKIWVDGLGPTELVEVLKDKNADLGDELLLQMATIHNKMAEVTESRQLGKKGGPYPFTLRDLLKMTKRLKTYRGVRPELNLQQLAWQQFRDVYEARFMNPDDRAAVEDILGINLGRSNNPADTDTDVTMKNDGKNVRIGDVVLPVDKTPDKEHVPGPEHKLIETPGTVKKLARLARSVQLDEPVLLVGPTAAGKTSLVRWIAHETNNSFRRVNLSNHTDTSDLIGGYFPAIDPDTKKPVPGKFEWRDGIIVEAMKKGQWLVLDEINLAEPAVLERLNSLLDPDRAIVLTEHLGEKVVADPNFRIFATMNPATADYAGRKDLSPAMRNRFTEQWFPAIQENSEIQTIMESWLGKMDLKDVGGKKVNVPKLAKTMTEYIQDMREKVKKKELPTAKKDGYHDYTLRGLKSWVEYVDTFLGTQQPNQEDPEGEPVTLDLKLCFVRGAKAFFGDGLRNPADRQTVEALANTYAEKL
ncbi:MAG: AAA family ATPase [Armatimonadetes bacterium]|nr:AAA family ATPase [Armatimonadota bacterium]